MSASAVIHPAELAGPVRPRPDRAVRLWLIGLAALVVLMVAVGGATRLTGSGLSITEWRPVTGAVPPLSDRAWTDEFDRYRASPQGRTLNRDMTLGEFKGIYWWEWGHRQLGRFTGLYAFGPLLWFWWRGAITGGFALRLLGIGALGGLQAGIGWVMVASGLKPGMVAVEPVKLTLHLLGASLILALLVWVASGLSPVAVPRRRPGTALAALLLGLVVVQIGLGGLVAGSHAGLTYNTWPLMDGALIPPSATLFTTPAWVESFVDNPALVQLDHRLVAYLVLAAATLQAILAWREDPTSRAFRRSALILALVLGQVALGIATLVLVVPLPLALAHQLGAMAVLAAATAHLRLSRREAASGSASTDPLREPSIPLRTATA